MSRFIKKVGRFSLWLVLGILLLSTVLNTSIESKASFKLKKNIKSIVFGHSHAECTFNDSLISNFKNMAQSGESYFYTYVKAKKVLEQNPQIENVFIEFSNIDITQVRDREIWSNKYINWRYPIYAPLMKPNEHLFLASKNPKAFAQAIPKTFDKEFHRILNSHYNFLPATSGYLYLEESKVDSLLRAKVYNEEVEADFYTTSYYNLKYLDKLIALCKEKELNICFVRSPLYTGSYYESNKKLFDSIKTNRFPDIALLDLKDFQLPNSDYRDFHHVNYKGAQKVSLWFNTWLQNNTTTPTIPKE